MPTTINGNSQAAGVAPDSGPGPEVSVSLSAFNDGEVANAASVLQLFTTVANHLAWLNKPRAKAVDWLKHIMSWRAANGHQRFALDHMGLPAGQWAGQDVEWKTSTKSANRQKFLTSEDQWPTMPEWTYKMLAVSGGNVLAMDSNDFGPCVQSRPGPEAGDYNTMSSGAFGIFRDDGHVTFEAKGFGPGVFTNRGVHLGLTPIIGLSSCSTASNFIGFRCFTSAGNTWECVTRAGGPETATVTAIAAPLSAVGPSRLRLEFHGATVADDLARAVRFYINGVLVATHTSDIPIGQKFGMAFSDCRDATDVETGTWEVGRMRLRMSTVQVNTVI